MSEPFLGEIRMVGFGFAPRGWAFCDGQLLPIDQNQALFSLLGTTFGGNGTISFGLPDLRGRTPIHVDSQHPRGHIAGQESHALALNELPQHSHTVRASANPSADDDPTASLLGQGPGNLFGAQYVPVAMGSEMIASAGGGQPHENMQPWLALNFCIALQGRMPSR
jgi:microcystin-dependent protein